MAKLTNEEMIARIKAFAEEHYDNGADFIVECYGDEEIVEAFLLDYKGEPRATWEEVLASVKQTIGLHSERREEVEAEIF